MVIEPLAPEFSVCQVADYSLTNFDAPYCFIGATPNERSLVCESSDVPANATECDDGWRGFRIQGVLDFSLVGILAQVSAVLSNAKIGVFALSTYNTDYVLVKEQDFQLALCELEENGYTIAPTVQ